MAKKINVVDGRVNAFMKVNDKMLVSCSLPEGEVTTWKTEDSDEIPGFGLKSGKYFLETVEVKKKSKFDEEE